MKWRLTHMEFPDGDPDRVVCSDIGQVWNNLNGLELDGKFPSCVVEEDARLLMSDLWEGDDPIAWMKLYNDNNILKEHFMVWDVEEDKQLL